MCPVIPQPQPRVINRPLACVFYTNAASLFAESVKENKNEDCHANGTTSTAGDVHLPTVVPGAGRRENGHHGNVPETPPPTDNSISLSPEQTPNSHTTQADVEARRSKQYGKYTAGSSAACVLLI